MKRAEYELNPKSCPECSARIPWEKRGNKFCGHSCAGKYSNKGKFWNKRKCRHCGQRPRLGELCDECRSKHWDPLRRLKVGNPGHPPRSALMKIRDYHCEGPDCLVKDTWNGKPIVLHFDHINGDRRDHRPENVRWLCPNCHSQTETYAGRNVGRYSGVVQSEERSSLKAGAEGSSPST
jgi:hypothetical protein